jgi:TPR repeat protein
MRAPVEFCRAKRDNDGMSWAPLFLALAAASPEKPIVAVFDIEDRGTKLAEESLSRLSDYLAAEIAASGACEIIPRDHIKERLLAQKKDSYRACFAESCQIELGQELAANRTLSTQVMKLGSQCVVAATLFDLRRSIAERGATAEGSCDEDGVTASIKRVVAKLTRPPETSPPSASLGPTTTSEAARCKSGDDTTCALECNEHVGEACYALGWKYERGRGTSKNERRAVELYQMACNEGAYAGCVALANAYRARRGGLEPDDARALLLYQRACDGGAASGCFGYGWMLKRGLGTKSDPDRAASFLERACDGKDLGGCTELGLFFASGSSVARGLDLLKRACDGGYAFGCGALGWFHKYGKGTLVDYARAAELLDHGCGGGDMGACSELAGMHQAGLGRPQDSRRAIELYKRSCEGGSPFGCGGLGWMYKYGYGVRQDYARAGAYLSRGCEGGDYGACHELAWLYEHGSGVRRDERRASDLLAEACRHGYRDSCRPSR